METSNTLEAAVRVCARKEITRVRAKGDYACARERRYWIFRPANRRLVIDFWPIYMQKKAVLYTWCRAVAGHMPSHSWMLSGVGLWA